jgi:type IV secretory pathway VirB4 component
MVLARNGYTGVAGGKMDFITAPLNFRGTTFQVCGLWPYVAGATAPSIGVPLGTDLTSGSVVCCDPISWFQRAKLISNPSVFILGQPGLGKSTIIRRMLLGLVGFGTNSFVLGDLKGEHVDLTRALDGQVISLGLGGRGYLNILDPGNAKSAIKKLTQAGYEKQAREIRADMQMRQLNMVSSLISISRMTPPTDREMNVLSRALSILNDKELDQILLKDLLKIIQNPTSELREIALDRGDMKKYKAITEDLEVSLIGLVNGGRLGEIFSKPTSEPMRLDRSVCFDVSSIDDSQMDLQAAVLLACWSEGFANINIAQTLADCSLEPRRHYMVTLDEMWRSLRAGRGMVDRIDALTRLNRARGVGLAMITHTMTDLLALANEEDRQKAQGFVERAGMVICGGLPSQELDKLNHVVKITNAERKVITSWTTPPGWNSETAPPGRGKFLIKVGGRPGIPIRVRLTQAEFQINDTNRLWV